MQIEDLRFNTKRKSAGRLLIDEQEEVVNKKEDHDEISLTSIDLPDASELMDKADLKTDKVYNQFQTQLSNTKQSWQEIDSYINDKQRWNDYKDRYAKIKNDYKKGNALQKIQSVKDLKNLEKN